MGGLDGNGFRGYPASTAEVISRRTPMTFTLLAAVPAVLLTVMYLYERREAVPLRARAARSTLDNALRGRR